MDEEILFEWNPWWRSSFEVDKVERDVEESVENWMDRPEVVALTGARRSGKTTLLHMIIDNLLDEVNEENVLFVKCDDERINDENVIESARKTYKEIFNPDGRTYMFLDEVQSQKNWSDSVKRIYDLKNEEKVFLTGSRVLKKELSGALAGRFARFDVYPFSFKEFLESKDIEIEDKKDALAQENEVLHLLREFIEWGGFPEIALEEDKDLKEELLNFYSDTILYRDVIERKQIQNTSAVEKLKSYALANISNLANYNKIGESIGIADDTVSKYLKAMEEAYFIFSMPIYSYSVKKQYRNPKKIYCIDTGIRNAAGFRFSEDIGRLYENTVFTQLKRKGLEPYYWKDDEGKETDFIIQENEEIKTAIQVSYNFKEAGEREIESLKSSIKELEPEKALILTKETRKTIEKHGKQIKVMPLWEWLLFNHK